MKDKRSSQGWGLQQYISCNTLFHHKNNSYYKNDTLKFRISYEHLNPLYEVAPFTVKISNFFEWFKSSEDYVSNPFFAFDGGYQMILKVTNIKENLYFSLHVMKDPHYDNLELSCDSGYWVIELVGFGDIHSDVNSCFKGRFYDISHLSITTVGIVGANLAVFQYLKVYNLLFDKSYHNYYRNDSLTFRIFFLDTKATLLPVISQTFHFSQCLEGPVGWKSTFFLLREDIKCI